MNRLKLAVLVSGRGSNLQAIIEACADPGYPCEIVLVLSNDPQAPALNRARAAAIPAVGLDHENHDGGRAAFDARIGDLIEDSGADLVVLAGYLRLLGAAFVARFQGRLVNIHPSLLPSFKGLRAHERAIAAGVRFSGCTVHYVTADMDAGPIIAQAAVPVRPGEDADALARRVLKAEHRLFPHCLRLIAEDRVRIAADGTVSVRDTAAPDAGCMLNPPPAAPGWRACWRRLKNRFVPHERRRAGRSGSIRR